MKKIQYTWKQFDKDVDKVLASALNGNFEYVYGIPSGGLPLAVALKNKMNLKFITNENDLLYHIHKNHKILIVDDIADTGETLNVLLTKFTPLTFIGVITLFRKPQSKITPHFTCNVCNNDDWIVFPWESIEQETIRDGTNK